MARNFRDSRQFSAEAVHLGTLIHPSGDLLVLKLEHKDIPYPNSPVLFNKKQIGKVDEIFGPVGDVYVAIRPDAGTKTSDFRIETKFEGYRDKFISSDRFLPREEVERKKELNDKRKKPEEGKSRGEKSLGRGRQSGGRDPRRDGGRQRKGGFQRGGGSSVRSGNPHRGGGDAGRGNKSPGHRRDSNNDRK